MNRFSIMGASIVLLLAAFVLNPAQAYHKRHHRYQQQPSYSYGLTSDHFVLNQSERRTRHQRVQTARRATRGGGENCIFTNEGRRVCTGAALQAAMATATDVRVVDAVGNRAYAAVDSGRIIGSRPNGCPHAYCGCGLRKYLGLEDKRLNLASNWARLFPRASGPRAGLAAVRRGHVMYIESAAGDGHWLVRDYNSGGGLSRLHVRDVRGYVFVDPHSAMASRS
jgi:hypothetical protein